MDTEAGAWAAAFSPPRNAGPADFHSEKRVATQAGCLGKNFLDAKILFRAPFFRGENIFRKILRRARM
jgi:hypothetical protein